MNWMTRRRALLSGLSVLGLAACDQQGGATPVDGGGSGKPSAAPGRTIEHLFGTTTVEGQPSRIAAVGYTDNDAVLALGVKPVTVTNQYGEPAGVWARPANGDHRPVIFKKIEDVSIEKLAAERPDLIMAVGSDIDRQAYDRFSKLAPTLVRPAGTPAYGVPWRDTARSIGRAMGREDRAIEQIKAVEAKFAATKAAHPKLAGRTITVGSFAAGAYYGFTGADSRPAFVTELGAKPSPALGATDPSKFYVDIAKENLARLDADVLVMCQNSQAETDQLKAEPLFQAIPAVKAGRVVYLGVEDGAALGYGSLLSLPYSLERIVPQMAKVLG